MLYLFGYESPDEHAVNQRTASDFESSTGFFIMAETPDEALAWGRQVSKAFVDWLFRRETQQPAPYDWIEARFAHWIASTEEHARFVGRPTVGVGEYPEFPLLLTRAEP